MPSREIMKWWMGVLHCTPKKLRHQVSADAPREGLIVAQDAKAKPVAAEDRCSAHEQGKQGRHLQHMFPSGHFSGLSARDESERQCYGVLPDANDRTSQMSTVVSRKPDASALPSGLNASAVTYDCNPSTCPIRVPFAASQSRIRIASFEGTAK